MTTRRTTSTRRLAAVPVAFLIALASAALLLVQGSAQALPRGEDGAYLTGRTLHLGDRDLVVPDQSAGGTYRATYTWVGGDGYQRDLVGVDLQPTSSDPTAVARVRLLAFDLDDNLTTVYDAATERGTVPAWRLGASRGIVLLTQHHPATAGSAAQTSFRFLGKDGNTLSYGGGFSPDLVALSLNRNRVILSGYRLGTRLWIPGESVRRLTSARTASVEGLLAVGTSRHRWGVATMARPQKIRWQGYFLPRGTSYDGKYVAGWSLSRKTGQPLPVIQVRRLSDGHLMWAWSRPSPENPYETTMGWENRFQFTFQSGVSSAPGAAQILVRCTLGRGCVQASDAIARNGDTLSFSGEDDPRLFRAFASR